MTDEEFLEEFENCRLTGDCWSHESHVRMAWLYLRQRPLDEVIPLVRRGIQHLNASRGRTEGYHETVTLAYLVLIDDAMRRDSGIETFAEFLERNPALVGRGLSTLREYYSQEVLSSDEAKARFVEPDRMALPRLPGG